MSRLADIDLAELKREFRLSAFIETGCGEGEALETAEGCGFSSLFSCDIREEAVRACREKFPRARIEEGDSLSCLEGFCKEVRERTFFWLDAHFPALYGVLGLGASEKMRFPLRLELQLIAQFKNFAGDVIVFDDLRCVRAPDNPTVQPKELESYTVYGWTIAALVAPFLATHRLEILDIYEGIGILKPL
jgi:hypothetical protein